MEKKKIKYWFWALLYCLPVLIMLIMAFRNGLTPSTYFTNIVDTFELDTISFGDLQENFNSIFNTLGLADGISNLFSWFVSYYVILSIVRLIAKLFVFIFDKLGGVVNE